MMSSSMTRIIGEVLETTDLLSNDEHIQSIWETFTETFSYEQRDKNEDDDFLDLILISIQTSFIEKLTLVDNVCDEIIDELVDILGDITSEGIDNDLTMFLTALLASLQKEHPFNKKIHTNIHINTSDQGKIVSTLDRNTILTVLVAHDSIPVDELESFLDKRRTALIPLAQSIIVDTRQIGDPYEKSTGVTSHPLSLRDFGTDLDKIIYWVTRFTVYNDNSIPDDLSYIKAAVFPIDRFSKERLFCREAFIINYINYRVLCATLQYISDTTEMWVNDCTWVLCKKINELIKIRMNINYLVSVDLAYVVLSILLLRILQVDGTPNSCKVAMIKLGLVQFDLTRLNRSIDMSTSIDFQLFGHPRMGSFQELYSYIDGREYGEHSININGLSTSGESNSLTIQDIYTRTGYFGESLAMMVNSVEERNTSGSECSAKSRSQYMVERVADKQQFLKLVSTLQGALNESLLAGNLSEVAVVLESMNRLQEEFAPIWNGSIESSEVSNALEKLKIYEHTYASYRKPGEVVVENANAMLSRFKKRIQD